MAVTVFLDDGPFEYFGFVSDRTGLALESQVLAEQYITYAQEDFASGTQHGLINALGNAKRALSLMIDTLLHNYGLLARNKRCNFPRKLQMLDRSGLISLSIFRRLNVERNLMEHEYRAPSTQLVSDAIDVCQLLLLAVERLCQDVPYEGLVGPRGSGKHAFFRLEAVSGTITLTELVNCRTVRSEGREYVPPLFTSIHGRTPTSDMLAESALATISLDAKVMEQWIPYLRVVSELRSRSGNRLHSAKRNLFKECVWLSLENVDRPIDEVVGEMLFAKLASARGEPKPSSDPR